MSRTYYSLEPFVTEPDGAERNTPEPAGLEPATPELAGLEWAWIIPAGPELSITFWSNI